MRLAVAGQAVVDDELAARIACEDTGELPRGQRAALQYADAHMTDPRAIDDELRDELHRCFTVEQLVELTLDMSAWNRQKVMVALEVDRPVDEHRLSRLTFDAAGHHGVSGTL